MNAALTVSSGVRILQQRGPVPGDLSLKLCRRLRHGLGSKRGIPIDNGRGQKRIRDVCNHVYVREGNGGVLSQFIGDAAL